MKAIKQLLMTVLATGLLCACHAQPSVRIDCNQPTVTRNHEITGFNALTASHAFEVDMFPSDRESVQIMVPGDMEKYVVVSQKGNTLYIGLKDGFSYSFRDKDCLKAYVYFKDLAQVKGSGAAEIDIKGTYDARNGNLTIDLSGASSFDGRVLNLAKLKAELSGASELDMKGSATDVELTASGASEADLEDLFVRNFSGHVSGASKAELNVSETFSGSASGASRIEVKGRPRVLKADDSGASTIRFE
ncbi:MAG: DUF2807 domain-containing protein [Bacteroides sp.]|nr:DUF2807 domain-containing protein [Bacteroides sp.]MCM1085445.1 DUF2807 domain-containing protein [Bacteroides sp.]